MVILDKISHYSNRVLMVIAGLFLMGMIFLTCSNIFLRVVWKPVSGTFELMGYFGAVLTAFALGYTQIKKGHISVDIVVLGFSQKTQDVLNAINNLICMAFFALAAWQIIRYGTTLWRTGEVTETLRIVYYPFTYGVALGCAVLSLIFLTEFLKVLMSKKEDEK
ncbi:MAG: TRAP transporter small permease [Desulfobacteraceae bacterium]|jgi:TRAP-type C4-dicarboxylate transport system permease small subunit|nr:TRAP transporter small permease [Desulfobacteraceae bacterium]